MRLLKRLFRLCIVLLVLWGILWLGLLAFAASAGKKMLCVKISQATGQKVSVGAVRLTPFGRLIVQGLTVGDVFEAGSIAAAPSIRGLLRGRMVLNDLRVIDPRAIIIQEKAGAPAARTPGADLIFAARHVRVSGGDVTFIDRSIATQVFQYRVRDIIFISDRAQNKTDFVLRAAVQSGSSTRHAGFSADGWLDWPGKDMQAEFAVAGLDAKDFYPYLSQWLDLGQTGIERAIFDFTGNVSGLRNAVTASCRMEFSEIAFKPLAEKEQPVRARRLAAMVVEALKQGAGGRGLPFVDFNLFTALDRPQPDFGTALRTAFEEKLSRAIIVEPLNVKGLGQLPGKLLTGTIKGAQGLTKGVFDSTIKTGNDLKSAVTDTFFKVKVAPEQRK